MRRRDFLGAAGLGVGALAASAVAQTAPNPAPKPAPRGDSKGRLGESKPVPKPRRRATTTKLFLTPPSWPNAISVQEGAGFWVQEQRHDRKPEKAWLLDFTTGKVLREVSTRCENTSGMVYADGSIWSGANGASVDHAPNPPVNGIFQTDLSSRQISHRQIPFGPKDNGGSCHGLAWEAGKLWMYANRLESLVRIDPKSWQVDYMFPVARDAKRLHGIEFDNGMIWQTCGIQDSDVIGPDGFTPGLVKYDARSGKVIEFVDFVPGSCDIHDVTVWNGRLYGVDAGQHPGWPLEESMARPGFPPLNSPSGGYVFRIDLI